MNSAEVETLITLISEADGWVAMDDLARRFSRQMASSDPSRSIVQEVESAVLLLSRQLRVTTARRGQRLLAKKA